MTNINKVKARIANRASRHSFTSSFEVELVNEIDQAAAAENLSRNAWLAEVAKRALALKQSEEPIAATAQ
jgi:hypothetical protein